MKHGELSLQDLPPESCISGWREGMFLGLSEDVIIRRYDMPDESFAIFNETSGLELELDASFQPLLGYLDGRYTAREIVNQYVGSGGQASGLETGFEELTHSALRHGTNELLQDMLQHGFLVERPVR
jgi:hypothetical protein